MVQVYTFGHYRQDPLTRILTRDGVPVAIAPKAFDILLYLVCHAGETVPREEIMKAVWAGTFVEDGNLNYNISHLRRILGEYQPGVPYIQTLPKQGYRFVAPVGRPPVSEPGKTQSIPAARSRRFWAGLVVATAGVASIIAIVVAAVLPRMPAEKLAGDLVRVTSDAGLAMTPALSRDGRFIAFASDRGGGNLNIWRQQVGGGAPVRITSDPFDDQSPSFSPDGLELAFRSERDGGGIYIVPASGGKARGVAPMGLRPRYSPDGKWIAYWVGNQAVGAVQPDFANAGTTKMFIIPAAGGIAREISPDFAAASYPVWTPDGKHLLFLGNRDANLAVEPTDGRAPGAASLDWWVTPIEGGPAVACGASAAFRSLGLSSVSQIPEAWTDDGSGVLMSAPLADTQSLWLVPISAGNWKVSGAPRRLTSGTGLEVQPAVSGNRVAFASRAEALNVWSLPMDSNRPTALGPLQRLTGDAFEHGWPSVSEDGARIAYSSRRNGRRDVWVRNLATGAEDVAPSSSSLVFGSVFSPDGGRIAIRAVEKEKSFLEVVSFRDGSREQFPCVSNGGWSSDGKRLLCADAAPARISMIDLDTKSSLELLRHTVWRLWNPRVSPDDRWSAFNASTPDRSRLFVAPVRTGQPAPESDWVLIANGIWDDKPRWSPDGGTLYFVSDRDRFRCIWAQRLDSRKHPVGDPVSIYHAHQARNSISGTQFGRFELSVARDKIVFNMTERTGNIWMMRLDNNY